MNAPRTGFWHSSVVLTAFVGFIMLFSALLAGYAFGDAGQEKWGNPAWTGGSSGVAITGFLVTAALALRKRRVDLAPRREALRPMQVDSGHI